MAIKETVSTAVKAGNKVFLGMDYARGKDFTAGKMVFPLKGDNSDYTQAKIKIAITEGVELNGIRIDHIARVGDHIEMAYTVTAKETERLLLAPQRITCSIQN